MKPAQIAIAAVAALALAGGGFAAGMTVGRGGAEAAASPSPSGAAGVRQQLVQGGRGAGGQGALGGAVSGRILAVNDGSITVEVRQPAAAAGGTPTTTSQIVLVGSSTRIVKTVETEAKLGDLKANDPVTIVGTTDANGNLSATAIVVGGNALQNILGGSRLGTPVPSARP